MMLSHNPIVEPFALAHATIVTGDKAGTILRNMTIVVGADGRIEQVAPSIETSIPAEYHYLDGTGKIVMPGLINAHTICSPKQAAQSEAGDAQRPTYGRHIRAFAIGQAYMAATVRHNATTLLESGVTTIRTLGDVGYEVVTLRDQIDAGQILGPRILASGPLMAIPEGHGAPLIALTSGTPGRGAYRSRAESQGWRQRHQNRRDRRRNRCTGNRRGRQSADERGTDAGDLR